MKKVYNIVVTLIFLFSLSNFTAIIKLYSNVHNANICSSNDNKNDDLSCLSHCALTQIDNLILNEVISFKKIFFFKKIDQREKQNFYSFSIDPKSNYPPQIV
mgnify:CR=1 FL=1